MEEEEKIVKKPLPKSFKSQVKVREYIQKYFHEVVEVDVDDFMKSFTWKILAPLGKFFMHLSDTSIEYMFIMCLFIR